MSIRTGRFGAFLADRAYPLEIAVRPGPRIELLANQRTGNSTMASAVATFSPAWLHTRTSISTQREFEVACLDFTTPVGRMVSPGRTGLSQRAWGGRGRDRAG